MCVSISCQVWCTHRHAHRHAHRHRHRHRQRYRYKETETETKRDTERHREKHNKRVLRQPTHTHTPHTHTQQTHTHTHTHTPDERVVEEATTVEIIKHLSHDIKDIRVCKRRRRRPVVHTSAYVSVCYAPAADAHKPTSLQTSTQSPCCATGALSLVYQRG